MRETLENYAKQVREEREELQGNCHKNSLALSKRLENEGIDHTIQLGVIVGDSNEFDNAVTATLNSKEQEEFGIKQVPTVVDGTIQFHEVPDTGAIHFWVEVPTPSTRYIVEPFAEMRGEYEHEAVAVPMEPIDYIPISDTDFSKDTLKRLVNDDWQSDITLFEAVKMIPNI